MQNLQNSSQSKIDYDPKAIPHKMLKINENNCNMTPD